VKDFRQSVLTQAVTGKLTEEWRVGKELTSAINEVKQLKKDRLKIYQLLLKQKSKNKRVHKPRFLNKEYTIESEYKLPQNWKWDVVDNLFDVNIGATPSRKKNEYWNGSFSWVSSGEVRNNIIYETKETITIQGVENSSVKIYPKGTVLIAMIGEGKTRGQSSLLGIDSGSNQNVAALRINQNFTNPKYIWYLFRERYEKTRNGGRGANQPALNGIKIGRISLPIPPLSEQTEIVRQVEHLFGIADRIEAQYEVLKAKIEVLPQAILAKAFRGELVEQLETDGDARKLLKEIKAMKAAMKPKKKK
jgi:type I restriction enzyme S subunit